MIPQIRKVSSVPQTHRDTTLRAIAGKAHDITARIERLRSEGDRFRQALQDAPEQNRLAWLNAQLHNT